MSESALRSKTRDRYGFAEAAQIVTLWGFAVAQPLYDLLARTPEFLVVRGSTLAEVVLFATALSLLVPLLLVGFPLLAGLVGRTPQRVVHFSLVALLAGALLLNAFNRLPLPAAMLLSGALAAGVSAAWAIRRWAILRTWCKVLAVTAIVFPLIFFWRVPGVVWGGGSGNSTWQVPAPENPTPIVFVLFDQLSTVSLLRPDGEIDASSFPNFAALARGADWYPLATTVHPFTYMSIPALLTGSYPSRTRQPILADHPNNLFTLLALHYDVTAQESLTRLCPPEICEPDGEPLGRRLHGLATDLGLVYLHILLPERLRSKLPPVDENWKDFGAGGDLAAWHRPDSLNQIRKDRRAIRGERAADFLRFLDRIEARPRSGGPPPLYFYASFLPHGPNEYLPSGRRYSVERREAGTVGRGRWGDDEWAILQSQQRYLLQVGLADRLLGLLVDRLREVGLYDEALLVVTSDHGVSFQPNGHMRGETPDSFAETLGVPLLIKLPHQREGRRDGRTAQTIDVLPTILDVLGIQLPLDGTSLLAFPLLQHDHARATPVHAGPAATAWVEELHGAIMEAVRIKTDRFGTAGYSTRFFQIGELGHLVGRRVEELGAPAASSVETSFVQPPEGIEFDPAEGFVPAQITGRSRPAGTGESRHFAVAVNGTVRAVTRTWSESLGYRRGEWSAVIDEAAFVPGPNRIEVFHLMHGAAEEVRLAPTGAITVWRVSRAEATGPEDATRAREGAGAGSDAGSERVGRRSSAGL